MNWISNYLNLRTNKGTSERGKVLSPYDAMCAISERLSSFWHEFCTTSEIPVDKENLIKLNVQSVDAPYRTVCCGDVVLGFILRYPESLPNIWVNSGRRRIHRLNLIENKATLVLGEYPVFKIHHVCNLNLSNVPHDAEIEVVYAEIVECDFRKLMYFHITGSLWHLQESIANSKIQEYLTYRNDGLVLQDRKPNQSPDRELPCFSWRGNVRKKQKELDIFREELIQRTWHPSRLAWCLDIDESRDLL